MASFTDAFRAALPAATDTAASSSPPPTRYQTPDTAYDPLPSAPERRRLPVVLTLITLLVFVAAFAAAYVVTTLLS
jgi:hypothetical protein